MQQIEKIRDPRRTPKTRQVDHLELLIAASEIEETCAGWIADRWHNREQATS